MDEAAHRLRAARPAQAASDRRTGANSSSKRTTARVSLGAYRAASGWPSPFAARGGSCSRQPASACVESAPDYAAQGFIGRPREPLFLPDLEPPTGWLAADCRTGRGFFVPSSAPSISLHRVSSSNRYSRPRAVSSASRRPGCVAGGRRRAPASSRSKMLDPRMRDPDGPLVSSQ